MNTFKATAITSDYHYGKLADFKVILRTKDAYINATKLCKKVSKEFSDWKRLKGSQELLSYYDRCYFDDEDEEDDPPGIPQGQQNEFKCIEIINNDKLQDHTDQQIKLIQGTYVPADIAIMVAQWMSPAYALMVSRIVREHHSSILTIENVELVKKNTDLNTQMEELKALIKGGHDEAMKQLVEVTQDNKTTHKMLSKLQLDVKSVKEYLKNQECSKEVIVYYRLKNDSRKNFCIRAGELKSVKKYFDEEVDDVTIYENISNPKLLLRKMKDLGYLPRNKLCNFEMEETKNRRKVRNFIGGVNTELSE